MCWACWKCLSKIRANTRLTTRPPLLPRARTLPDTKVLLPTGVLRVDCKPGTANFRVAEDVVWRSDRTTSMIGVVPGFKGGDELNAIGTAARAVKIVRVRNRGQVSYTLLLEGVARVRVKSIEQESPFIRASVEPVNDTGSGGTAALVRISGVVDEFRKASRRLIELLRERIPLVAKFQPLLDSTAPEKLCDLFVGAIDATFEERLAVRQLCPFVMSTLHILTLSCTWMSHRRRSLFILSCTPYRYQCVCIDARSLSTFVLKR